MDDNERLLTQEEAAAYLNLSPSTLNGWRVMRRGPAYLRLTPRCIRYRLADLRRWAESNRVVGPEAKRLEQPANR